jgi:hypothetical protein
MAGGVAGFPVGDLLVDAALPVVVPAAAYLTLFALMPLYRIDRGDVRVGNRGGLAVRPGRHGIVVLSFVPFPVRAFGVWRDDRDFLVRAVLLRSTEVAFVVFYGGLWYSLLGSDDGQVLFVLIAVAGLWLMVVTHYGDSPGAALIASVRARRVPGLTDRARNIRDVHDEFRFALGDDRPMRERLAAGGPDRVAEHHVAYIEGRFDDALYALEGLRADCEAAGPRALRVYVAKLAMREVEVAFLAAESGQLAVADMVARFPLPAKAAPQLSHLLGLKAALTGDLEAALRLARRGCRAPSSRLDLVDAWCTLAHVQGLLGRDAEAAATLDRARRLAPAYARPDAVARRLGLLAAAAA